MGWWRFRRRVILALDLIDQKLDILIGQGGRTMAAIDDLLADVEDEDTVLGSLEQLLTNLSALLANAGTDPAKIAQIRTLVDTQKARILADIAANTPQAPPTP